MASLYRPYSSLLDCNVHIFAQGNMAMPLTQNWPSSAATCPAQFNRHTLPVGEGLMARGSSLPEASHKGRARRALTPLHASTTSQDNLPRQPHQELERGSMGMDAHADVHVQALIAVSNCEDQEWLCIQQSQPGGKADVYRYGGPMCAQQWALLAAVDIPPLATVYGLSFSECPDKSGEWHNYCIRRCGNFHYAPQLCTFPNKVHLMEPAPDPVPAAEAEAEGGADVWGGGKDRMSPGSDMRAAGASGCPHTAATMAPAGRSQVWCAHKAAEVQRDMPGAARMVVRTCHNAKHLQDLVVWLADPQPQALLHHAANYARVAMLDMDPALHSVPNLSRIPRGPAAPAALTAPASHRKPRNPITCTAPWEVDGLQVPSGLAGKVANRLVSKWGQVPVARFGITGPRLARFLVHVLEAGYDPALGPGGQEMVANAWRLSATPVSAPAGGARKNSGDGTNGGGECSGWEVQAGDGPGDVDRGGGRGAGAGTGSDSGDHHGPPLEGVHWELHYMEEVEAAFLGGVRSQREQGQREGSPAAHIASLTGRTGPPWCEPQQWLGAEEVGRQLGAGEGQALRKAPKQVQRRSPGLRITPSWVHHEKPGSEQKTEEVGSQQQQQQQQQSRPCRLQKDEGAAGTEARVIDIAMADAAAVARARPSPAQEAPLPTPTGPRRLRSRLCLRSRIFTPPPPTPCTTPTPRTPPAPSPTPTLPSTPTPAVAPIVSKPTGLGWRPPGRSRRVDGVADGGHKKTQHAEVQVVGEAVLAAL